MSNRRAMTLRFDLVALFAPLGPETAVERARAAWAFVMGEEAAPATPEPEPLAEGVDLDEPVVTMRPHEDWPADAQADPDLAATNVGEKINTPRPGPSDQRRKRPKSADLEAWNNLGAKAAEETTPAVDLPPAEVSLRSEAETADSATTAEAPAKGMDAVIAFLEDEGHEVVPNLEGGFLMDGKHIAAVGVVGAANRLRRSRQEPIIEVTPDQLREYA